MTFGLDTSLVTAVDHTCRALVFFDENPVVNRADELVDREIDVSVRRQLAALAGPEESGTVALALRGDEPGLKTRRDGRVVLRLAGQGTEDGSWTGR